MRLATILAVLAVATMATTLSAAGTAHLTMTVGGSDTFTPTPGATFRVDVEVTATVPMTAWGMELRDENDRGYTIVGSVLGGYYANIVMNYVDAGPPGAGVNTAGWAVHEALVAFPWPSGDMDGVRPGTSAEDLEAGAVSGWAMYFELTAPAIGPLDTRFVLDDLYVQDLDFKNILTMTYDTPTVLPEPASAALLALGGLVLMRRRRR